MIDAHLVSWYPWVVDSCALHGRNTTVQIYSLVIDVFLWKKMRKNSCSINLAEGEENERIPSKLNWTLLDELISYKVFKGGSDTYKLTNESDWSWRF